jgi:hypothetical protein
MAGPKIKRTATFQMQNEDGDVITVDASTASAYEAKGYERLDGTDLPGDSTKSQSPGPAKPTIDRDKLASLTKDQLRQMCTDNGLPPTGNKPDLIETLAEAGIGPVVETEEE